MARDRAHQGSGGPRVAGIELAAGMVRAVVARAEGGRLRVVGRGETALAADAIAGGLVVEPGAVTAAVTAALAAAERGVPAERTVMAIDGDDVRTYHVKTPFDREESGTPIVRAEADRELAPYWRKMPALQIDQLQRQYVHKRLLERYGLPRLSLFYM